MAMVTMMLAIRSQVTRSALRRPSSVPTPSATPNRPAQPISAEVAAETARYCAIEATAVNEMSSPPATSTTTRPAASMPENA